MTISSHPGRKEERKVQHGELERSTYPSHLLLCKSHGNRDSEEEESRRWKVEENGANFGVKSKERSSSCNQLQVENEQYTRVGPITWLLNYSQNITR